MNKKWDVFISHASEDKEGFVRELAEKLTSLGIKVWYDEFTLKLGDSLIDSINYGLSQSSFGVLILSPNFLLKKWTEIEYKSLITKEERGKKSILPIWYNIQANEVKEFSLYLADKMSLDHSIISTEKIAIEICEIVRPDIMQQIRASLIFKELLKNSKSVKVKASKVQRQTTPQSKLSNSQLCRAKNIYLGIGKHTKSTFEDTVYNFELDLHPNREIQIWEMMNATYLEFLEKYEIDHENFKYDVYKILVGFSMGIIPEETYLSDDQLTDLSEIWKQNIYEL